MNRSPELSVCEGMLRMGSLAEDIAAASDAGYTSVQIEQRQIEAVGVAEARRLLHHAGVSVTSMGSSPADPLLDDGSAVRHSIELAVELGIGVVPIHPGPLREFSHAEAAERTRSWLGAHGPHAARSGVVLALEPIHPLLRHYSWIHTLRHAGALADGIDGAGVMVDIAHLWWDPDLVADFGRFAHLVRMVQLANVASDALREERYARAPLGIGEIPVAGLVRAFRDAGYDAPYELEVRVRMPRSDRIEFVRQEREWFIANIS